MATLEEFFVRRRTPDGRSRRPPDAAAPTRETDSLEGRLAAVEEDERTLNHGPWLHSQLQLRGLFLDPEACGWDDRRWGSTRIGGA